MRKLQRDELSSSCGIATAANIPVKLAMAGATCMKARGFQYVTYLRIAVMAACGECVICSGVCEV
jgi:hypothetical protein